MSGRVLYGRRAGIHLNAEGIRQAEALSSALKARFAEVAVHSSPLDRALETARVLAESYDQPVRIQDALTEIDFGDWVGKSFVELGELKEWRNFNSQRTTCNPPRGESMMEVQARAWRAIAEATAELQSGETAAFVTHGDVIRCVLVLLLGVSIDHIHRIEISPGSVSEVLLGDHAPLIRNLNQVFY